MGRTNDLYMRQVENEEDEIYRQEAMGMLTLHEAHERIRDLHQDVRERAQDAAEYAYDLAMGR